MWVSLKRWTLKNSQALHLITKLIRFRWKILDFWLFNVTFLSDWFFKLEKWSNSWFFEGGKCVQNWRDFDPTTVNNLTRNQEYKFKSNKSIKKQLNKGDYIFERLISLLVGNSYVSCCNEVSYSNAWPPIFEFQKEKILFSWFLECYWRVKFWYDAQWYRRRLYVSCFWFSFKFATSIQFVLWSFWRGWCSWQWYRRG